MSMYLSQLWEPRTILRGRIYASRWIVCTLSVLCIFLLLGEPRLAAQVTVDPNSTGTGTPRPLIQPGGSPPPPGCGLVCESPATITISLSMGWNLPLQGQTAWADYVVTNRSLRTLSGSVVVTLDGQVMTDANPHTITLAPGQFSSGQVWLAQAPAGNVSLRAQYLTPPQCTGPVKRDPTHPGKAPCTPGQLWAEAFGSGTVYPDGDRDGLGDNFENQLLQTYAPLLLFSYDHGSEEKYAPIDVIDFIRGSTLVSKESDVSSISDNATLNQTPGIVLNPTGVSAVQDAIGTISKLQQPLGPVLGTNDTDRVPRTIYVAPSSQAQNGANWSTVMNAHNVGLYGHVVMLNVAQILDNAGQAFDDPVAQSENRLLYDELFGIYCSANNGQPCDASIIKIEYWQFFGYSHDLEDPIPGTSGIAADVIDHGGDWCTVQLYVDAVKAFTQPDQAILAVHHFAHGLRFGFDMQRLPIASGVITPAGVSDGLKAAFQQFTIKQFQGPQAGATVNLPFENGKSTQDYKNAQNNIVQLAQDPGSGKFVHPVVYVEWGGHEFWPTWAWSLEFASKHGGDSKKSYRYIVQSPLNVGEVGNPMPGVAQAPFVTGFAGFWGYYGWENQNKPPQGPPLHAEWLWYPGTDPNLLKVRPAQYLPPW